MRRGLIQIAVAARRPNVGRTHSNGATGIGRPPSVAAPATLTEGLAK
jgi:hypothetical protein